MPQTRLLLGEVMLCNEIMQLVRLGNFTLNEALKIHKVKIVYSVILYKDFTPLMKKTLKRLK